MIPAGGELVMCSRCPFAMRAELVEHTDGSFSVIFYCESCDRRVEGGQTA